MAAQKYGMLALLILAVNASPSVSPTESPSVSPSHNPSSKPSLGPSASPTVSPTHVPTHTPTPAPTPQPSECNECPACVLCPPGDARDELVFSDGTAKSDYPGFAGHFIPETQFTTLSEYCPPRDVGSCPACSCSNEDECFSCVADSHHKGYKARQADDQDDNTKSPEYDGEKSLDDVNGDDDIVSLLAMLQKAEKEVEEAAAAEDDDDDDTKSPEYDGEKSLDDVNGDDDTVSLLAMLQKAEKDVEEAADDDDVLSQLRADQETYEEMSQHEMNTDKIDHVNSRAVEEEAELANTINNILDANRDKMLVHEVNTAKVAKVNEAAPSEEDLLAASIAKTLEEKAEALSNKDATKKANSIYESEESALLKSINSRIKHEASEKDQLQQQAEADALATKNKEAVRSVISAMPNEEALLLKTISKLSDSTDKFDMTDFVQEVVYDNKGDKKLAHKEQRAVKKAAKEVESQKAKQDIFQQADDREDLSSATSVIQSASNMIDSSECFICSGFSDKTCATALTTVIAGLSDHERLNIEKELMDADESTCGGLKDKDCLESLDTSFAALNSNDKVNLLGQMCDLVTGSTTLKSKKLGQHTSRDTIVVEDKEDLDQVEKAVEVPQGPRHVVAHKPVRATEIKHEVEVAPAHAAVQTHKQLNTCEICDGFSQKTCALALTNVISGLSDKTRLTIEKSLLDAEGAICNDLKDKDCLSALDSSFDSLQTSSKLHLVNDMCDLLTAADIPTSSVNQIDTTGMTDDAISKSTHTINTRDALLNFDAPVTAPKVKLDIKVDALVTSLELDDEPRCVVCDSLSDRSCLAGLEASLRSLSDNQRLLVLARTMGAYPSYTTCDAHDGDRTCLTKLDKAYEALSSSQKLSVLTDACTLGAYGTAAATLAVISTTESVSNVKATMTDLSQNTDFKMHALISTVASVAADMLAARGGVSSLQGGRAASLISAVTSWTSTVSALATEVVPVVTATKDTTSTSSMIATASSAVSSMATQVRTLVSFASGAAPVETSSSKSSSSSSSSPNMASKLGESAFGFVLGAAGAAALVYSVFALRRSLSQNRTPYSKIPDELEAKYNDRGYEAPAFVLSL